jgi:hypothetical protein
MKQRFLQALLGSALLGAVLISALPGCVTAKSPGPVPAETYYVKADGSDRNDGLSEASPFRSLFKALAMASRGPIKKITLIGVLNIASEQSSSGDRVFLIQGTGKDLITITGKSGSAEGKGAVLSGFGANRRVVLVKGNSTIRLENIEISGGVSEEEGGGIGIGPGARLTLGPGAEVTGNRAAAGGGMVVSAGGTLVLDGGVVWGNQAKGSGGAVVVSGKTALFTMEGGVIRDNQAESGGAVAVFNGGAFTLREGFIKGNRAAVAGGGVAVQRDTGSSFIKEGGILYGSEASSDDANRAGTGSGACVIRGGAVMVRNTTAGEETGLDSSKEGADGGWE